MDSTTIQKHLNKLLLPRVKTVGVYASDRLPIYIAPSTAWIVNTKPHYHGGEHWVAFYRPPNSSFVEYFDSLGRPPFFGEYQQLLRRSNLMKYKFTNYRLQGYNTQVCGHYCLVYLYCRIILKVKSLNEFIQLFDLSRKQQRNKVSPVNDTIIRHMFNLLFSSTATPQRQKRQRRRMKPTA